MVKMNKQITIIIILLIIVGCYKDPVLTGDEANSDIPKVVKFLSEKTIVLSNEKSVITCKFNYLDTLKMTYKFEPSSGIMEGAIKNDTAKNSYSFSQTFRADTTENIVKIKVLLTFRNKTVTDSIFVSVQKNDNIPSKPYLPVPLNGKINVPSYQVLSWSTIVKTGVSAKYDVYLSEGDADPLLYKSNVTTNNCKLVGLKYNTKYKWKIIAKYTDSELSEGEIWSFTTRSLVQEELNNAELMEVPAGEFLSGKSKKSTDIPYSFKIMKFEVTNKQFADFLLAVKDSLTVTDSTVIGFYDGDSLNSSGKYLYFYADKNSKISVKGKTFTLTAGYENHPAGNVTWFGAKAFALYYKMDLPTDLEWEKAARGKNGLEYPSGDILNGTMANIADSIDSDNNGKFDSFSSIWKGTSPVGAYNGTSYFTDKLKTVDSKSPFGCYDMAGNVWEWTLKISGSSALVAGGSYILGAKSCYSWIYFNYLRSTSLPYIGFRCVKK